jgi:hypothetical protein
VLAGLPHGAAAELESLSLADCTLIDGHWLRALAGSTLRSLSLSRMQVRTSTHTPYNMGCAFHPTHSAWATQQAAIQQAVGSQQEAGQGNAASDPASGVVTFPIFYLYQPYFQTYNSPVTATPGLIVT